METTHQDLLALQVPSVLPVVVCRNGKELEEAMEARMGHKETFGALRRHPLSDTFQKGNLYIYCRSLFISDANHILS